MRRYIAPLLPIVLVAALGSCGDPTGIVTTDVPLRPSLRSSPDGMELPQVQPREVSAGVADVVLDKAAADVGAKVIQPIAEPQPSPAPAKHVLAAGSMKDAIPMVESFFARQNGKRRHIQLDKPLYKPGESVWYKLWDVQARTLIGNAGGGTAQLISPKGAAVLERYVQLQGGEANGDFIIPEGVPGGQYKVRLRTNDGQVTERPLIVSTYDPPRIKKKLEFLRKAYGPGDEVSATIKVERATGEALADKVLEGAIRLDGVDLPPVKIKTNAFGGGIVRFTLPDRVARGDGLLTVLIEDGGVTESVSKSIPIVLDAIDLELRPEGGDLVEQLPGRVYFRARNTLGKPADVKGVVVDDKGATVARFESFHQGMGRFAFTPLRGRKYEARITQPIGVKTIVPLPASKRKGCVLQHFDDDDSKESAIRVGVTCTRAQRVTVSAVMREQLLSVATVKVAAKKTAAIHLTPQKDALLLAQGVVRLTAWDDEKNPLAERLVYRNRRAKLDVEVKANKAVYGPRERVELTLRTRAPSGEPAPAALALSVVDDTVISFADDKTGHMLSRVYLEPELPGKIEEPNFYFDLTEKKSGRALDMLLGSQGWRRFAWKPVVSPPPPPPPVRHTRRRDDRSKKGAGRPSRVNRGKGEVRRRDAGLDMLFGRAAPEKPKEVRKKAKKKPRAAPGPVAALPVAKVPPRDEAAPVEALEEADKKKRLDDRLAGDELVLDQDGDWEDAGVEQNAGGAFAIGNNRAGRRNRQQQLAPVRVFPVPDYVEGAPVETRTDFRETIFFAPNVKTDARGEATVSFFTSDAITTFRVFTEGIGAGAVAHHEHVFTSTLPFAMAVKIPTEVSAGDTLMLPVTMTNARDKDVDVRLRATLGDDLALRGVSPVADLALTGADRKSLFFPVDVVGRSGATTVKLEAQAGQLTDAVERTINVVPVGFPQSFARSGDLEGKVSYTLDLGAPVEGSVVGSVRFYPSPLSNMVSGVDAMLRQPSGCFEQASSANYPNIMVMQYLDEHNVASPDIATRANKLLDDGYKKLTGYESDKGGYEWFGQYPGHEALTAYGLVEFADMKRVYPNVDTTMVDRTQAWLKSRRDGEGGYKLNPKALDSFGRASPEVTAAYITYSITEAGYSDASYKTEIDAQARIAATTDDAYILALATNTLLNVKRTRQAGLTAAARLAEMQNKASGHWDNADHSITRSGGQNLHIETTALATMALLKSDAHKTNVRDAVAWLGESRRGGGQWGTTQANVLALKAMTMYASSSKQTRNAGTAIVIVNGNVVKEFTYQKGHRDPIVIDGLGDHLRPGKNTIDVVHEGVEAMPYTLGVDYNDVLPATSDEAVVGLTTRLERDTMKMGENVRMWAEVKNTTDKGQPMALARVGLPGGLSFQTWQLEALRDKGVIGFYETRAREVILYFRDLKPNAALKIPLDLVATIPGTLTAPASSAYLYYTDEHKTWTPGLKASITP